MASSHPSIDSPPHGARRSAVPLRGLLIGTAASLLINWYNHHIRLTVGSQLSISHFPFLLFATLLLLTLVLRPRLLALSRNDLVAAMVVGFVGTAVPPMVIRFVATITAPYYFATPENRWEEYAYPYLPRWLFPSNDGGEMAAFYQGLLPGERLPWEVWVGPLLWWLGLIVAMLLGCVFIAVIFRRQWVDRERLAFPHVQVSLSLIDTSDDRPRLAQAVRSPLFKIGFALAFLPVAWNTISYFSPGFPTLNFIRGYPTLTLARGFPVVYTKFDFYVIGFAFFTPLQILFSIWFFHVLSVIQVGISQRVGFGPSTWDSGTNWQTAGGMIAFVLWGVWISRGHLRDVWRRAWHGDPDVDDSGELVSYRTALFGGAVCTAFVVGWLLSAGMTPTVLIPFVGLYLVLSLGVAKIVSMAGLISLRWPWEPNKMMMGTFGSDRMGMSNFAVLSVIEALHCIWKGFALSGASNAARMGDELEGSRRVVGRATMLAGVGAIVLGVVSLVVLGYVQGAENFRNFVFQRSNRFTYELITAAVTNPKPVLGEEMAFCGAGFLITMLLTYLMYRFTWWPLHPLGSTISFSWPIRASAFSIFIAWAVKAVLLQVGGISLYRRSQSLFVGLLVGYAAGVLLSLVIDVVWFPGQGHGVHSVPM